MTLKTRLFLASSSELKAERGAMDARINSKNKLWHADGIFLHLDVWEDFIDAMSRTRLQDEYNAAIRTTDIFVLLVHTKVGKYSAEEFETAHAQFQAKGKPRIYTYFKQPSTAALALPEVDMDSVRALQKRLADLGHFPTPVENVHELIDHFTQQLDKLRAAGVICGDSNAARDADATSGTSYRATVGAGGASAQGPGAQAVVGGVAIGGNNSAPIHVGTRIDTGGGAYVGGNVTVTQGDFVGRDKLTHNHPPAQASGDMAATFATLLAALDRQTSTPNKELAQEHVAALQEECANPPAKRDDKRMARLLDGLVNLVPGAVSAVVAAFASPVLGAVAGPATTALIDQFKKP
jgi:hypothetical protein